MPTNYTPNYQLNQWEKSDRVLMEDFNADNAKIEAAIQAVNRRVDEVRAEMAEIPWVVAGSYVGDGAESRFIDLGFTPKAVLVTRYDGSTYNMGDTMGGLAVPGAPAYSGKNAVEIVEGGFMVMDHKNTSLIRVHTNLANQTYQYLAVR